MPETCPNCQAPRTILMDGKSFFKCGGSTDGRNARCPKPTPPANPFIPKPRFIFANGSCRCEVTGPDGKVYEFSGVRKDPVGFGETK